MLYCEMRSAKVKGKGKARNQNQNQASQQCNLKTQNPSNEQNCGRKNAPRNYSSKN
jgi:hypothetical protein